MTDDSADADPADEPPAASAQPLTIAVEDPTGLLPPVSPAPEAPDADAPDDGTAAGDETEPAKAGRAPVPLAAPRAPRGWPVPTAVAVATVAVVAATLVIVFDRPSAGPATPGPRPTGSACLVGRWQSTRLEFNGVPATGTETITFGADDTGDDRLDNVTVSRPDGHTHMLNGDIDFRYIAATGIVNYASATGTLVDDDLTGGPTTRETPRYAPRTYTCTSTDLILTNGTAMSRFTRA